jgi:hypothetical protein
MLGSWTMVIQSFLGLPLATSWARFITMAMLLFPFCIVSVLAGDVVVSEGMDAIRIGMHLIDSVGRFQIQAIDVQWRVGPGLLAMGTLFLTLFLSISCIL